MRSVEAEGCSEMRSADLARIGLKPRIAVICWELKGVEVEMWCVMVWSGME